MQMILFNNENQTSYKPEDFVISESNRLAYNFLHEYDEGLICIVYGPTGSGKTHLAHVWQARENASFLKAGCISDPNQLSAESCPVIIEDIHSVISEENLLHQYNYAVECRKKLLMTSQLSPSNLKIRLKDLKSRLVASNCVQIHKPDDALLRMILVKLLSDRQIRIDTKAMDYILTHTERSVTSLRLIVNKIEQSGLFSLTAIKEEVYKQNI